MGVQCSSNKGQKRKKQIQSANFQNTSIINNQNEENLSSTKQSSNKINSVLSSQKSNYTQQLASCRSVNVYQEEQEEQLLTHAEEYDKSMIIEEPNE